MLITTPHYKVENLGASIRFISPYRKSEFRAFVSIISLGSILLLPLLLPIIMPGRIDLALVLRSPVSPIIILAIIFAVIGVILQLIELLWLVTGLEVVEISENQIIVRHQVIGLGISRKFRSESITGVFVSRQKNDWLTYFPMERGNRFLDFRKGLIAINYGKTILGKPKTFRFGSSLNHEEAKEIVAIIHQKFLQYKYRNPKNTG